MILRFYYYVCAMVLLIFFPWNGIVNAQPKNSNAIVSFASTNVRTYQNQPVTGSVDLSESLTAWKGERVNAQVLIWSKKDLVDLKVKISSFTKSDGQSFNSASCSFIEYIAADLSAGICGKIPAGLPQVMVADRITAVTTKSIKMNQCQPVWVTVNVPASIPAGTYTANISFTASNAKDFNTLSLAIKVNNRVLPPPSQWAFHLDMWQYPLRVSTYYKVKPWSPEHFNALRPTMQMLANAGQKVITTSFFWDCMNSQDWGADNLMIKINKNSNGSFSYDFTNFDKWVTFMMSLGINDQISCFGMYPFTNNLSYQYNDVAQQKSVKSSFTLSSNNYNDFWFSMLVAFAKHLRQKGWMDKTVLYFDERPPKSVIELIGLIKKADNDFKVGYAGGYNEQLNKYLYDFSIVSYLKINPDALSARKQANEVTTFYTTCTVKKPNIFTFSNPAEAVSMGWIAAANNYDGYARYAYDIWESNSTTNSRSTVVPSGDQFMIYPESYSSVRFEKLREGIEDYTKISILEQEFQRSNNQGNLRKIANLKNGFKVDQVKSVDNFTKLVEDAQNVINNM